MISFYINNIEIVLPEDFSVTLIEENPLVTRKGDFSLDVETSLLEPRNAKAFKHINRINKSSIEKTGDCKMLINNEFIYGQYSVLGYTDISVKWQFIAGNSYLNYLAKDDQKIWEFDFGTESAVDFAKALLSIQNPGYSSTNHFVCAPVKSGSIVLNNYTFNTSFDPVITYTGVNNITIQPYLLYYVNKLPELIGYTMKGNVLNTDERAKYMFLVNTVNSLNYSDYLPDLTITEFIEAIETFFNVSFVLDPRNKEVSIINTNINIRSLDVEKLNNILDNYNSEFEDEDINSSLFCSKISYAHLSGSQFMKYNRIDDSVLVKLEKKEFDTLALLLSYISADLDNLYSKPILYIDKSTGNHYMFHSATSFQFPYVQAYSGNRYVRKVNKFRDVDINNFGFYTLNLLISPANIEIISVVIKYTKESANYTDTLLIQIAGASNSSFIDETKQFAELVENGAPEVPRLGYIEAAFFMGQIAIQNPGVLFIYPAVWVDSSADAINQQSLTLPYPKCTFRIHGLNGILSEYYGNQISIDNNQIFIFKLSDDDKKMPVNKIYEYNNQTYLPIRFEHVVNHNSIKTIGYFYRIEL